MGEAVVLTLVFGNYPCGQVLLFEICYPYGQVLVLHL